MIAKTVNYLIEKNNFLEAILKIEDKHTQLLIEIFNDIMRRLNSTFNIKVEVHQVFLWENTKILGSDILHPEKNFLTFLLYINWQWIKRKINGIKEMIKDI